MLRSSIPIGRFLGVALRMHISFPMLLVLSILYSESTNGGAARGVALWLALCFAVFVRETARAIAGAYVGIQLRGLLLLPIGGKMDFIGIGEEDDTPFHRRLMMLSGPLANVLAGLLLLGTAYALEPHVSLFGWPWIGTGHILSSFVWLQMLLGAPSLLALPVVTSSRKAAPKARDAATDTATSAAAPVQTRRKGFPIRIPRLTLGVAISLSALFVGCVLRNQWLVVLGIFLMLGLYLSRPHTVSGTDAGDLLVREVMLTEYTLLSSSDTLRGALDRTMHSLQDVFPVVRGDQLVGSVTRHAISYRFRVHGDSYLQGIMERKVPLAVPSEKLVDVLQRTSTPGSGEFIPVVEDGAMVGILTRQSLGQVVRQAKMSGPTPAPREQS